MNKYLRLLRIQQWYKNLVIFLAVFFTNNLSNTGLLIRTIFGFIALCLVSSSYYILNDIWDVEEDKRHPEKKNRPIASGEIEKGTALFISALLLILSLLISYNLSLKFAVFPIVLFLLSIAYNVRLKDVAIIDVHMIALNFLLKAISGAVLIEVPASSWLVITIFFMALLLGVSKRLADMQLLGEDVIKHKKVYRIYNRKLLEMLIVVISAILLFAYGLYSFIVHGSLYAVTTLPFASFMTFRYLYFVSINHEAARKTQLIFKDKQMLIAFILWIITSYIVMNVESLVFLK